MPIGLLASSYMLLSRFPSAIPGLARSFWPGHVGFLVVLIVDGVIERVTAHGFGIATVVLLLLTDVFLIAGVGGTLLPGLLLIVASILSLITAYYYRKALRALPSAPIAN